MTIYLKQSTASQEIPLGYFVDSADGNTEETGLTIANTDIKIWKTGATTLANKNSGGATHISNGIYYAVLDATDTDTLGSLVVFVHVSGALTVKLECVVLAANIYDSMIGASDKLQVHADEITNGLITAAAIATGAIDADAIADNAIDAGAIAADAITAAKIADGAIDAATFAAGAITSTVIASNAIDADALAADAVTEIWAGSTAPTAAAVADAVWDELKADHTTPDTFGDYLDDEITSRSTLDAAGVRSAVGLASANLDTQLSTIDTVVDSILVDTGTDIPASIDALPTAAENADAIWDEALSGHTTAGTAGKTLSDAGAAGDPWSTSLPGAYNAGEAGYIIGNNLNAPVGTIDTVVDAIKAKTDNLPTDPADASDITAAFAVTDGLITTVDTVVDAIKLKTDNLPASPANETTVSAVKAKTDSLTFTVANQLDVNLQYINDTALTGDGSATPWGPA